MSFYDNCNIVKIDYENKKIDFLEIYDKCMLTISVAVYFS